MSPLRPSMLLVATLVLSTLGGCSKRRDETAATERPKVTLVFKKDVTIEHVKRPLTIGDDDIDNATLLVDGKESGFLIPREDGPVAVVELPEGASLADRSVKLALRLPTPCGTHIDVPLPAYETNLESVEAEQKMLRERAPTVQIKRGAGAELPADQVTIWVDDIGHEEAKITFGTAQVFGRVIASDGKNGVPGRRMQLWGSRCAAKHDVTVNGAIVGQAVALEDTKAFLISAEPNLCYQRVVHRYASVHDSVGGGSTEYELPTGQVVPMPWTGFAYFLRPAPRGLSGEGSTKRSTLERVACGTAKKEAAPTAAPRGGRPGK